MLEQIATALEQLVLQTGYIGIFIATVVESFFAPIPSEIILVSAGYASKSSGGLPTLVIMCIFAALGNYVGTLPFYLISRMGAKSFLPKFIDRWGPFLLISNKDLEKAEKLFHQRGRSMVFFARLIPGIRSLIAFPAGVSKMPILSYTIFTLLGSLSWNLFLGGIGFFAYDAKDQIFALLAPVEKIILALIIIVVVLYSGNVIYQIRKMLIARKETPAS
jgi:membrane protein DedA with SNARE-associated domain